jgi:hypothetical protein
MDLAAELAQRMVKFARQTGKRADVKFISPVIEPIDMPKDLQCAHFGTAVTHAAEHVENSDGFGHRGFRLP